MFKFNIAAIVVIACIMIVVIWHYLSKIFKPKPPIPLWILSFLKFLLYENRLYYLMSLRAKMYERFKSHVPIVLFFKQLPEIGDNLIKFPNMYLNHQMICILVEEEDFDNFLWDLSYVFPQPLHTVIFFNTRAHEVLSNLIFIKKTTKLKFNINLVYEIQSPVDLDCMAFLSGEFIEKNFKNFVNDIGSLIWQEDDIKKNQDILYLQSEIMEKYDEINSDYRIFYNNDIHIYSIGFYNKKNGLNSFVNKFTYAACSQTIIPYKKPWIFTLASMFLGIFFCFTIYRQYTLFSNFDKSEPTVVSIGYLSKFIIPKQTEKFIKELSLRNMKNIMNLKLNYDLKFQFSPLESEIFLVIKKTVREAYIFYDIRQKQLISKQILNLFNQFLKSLTEMPLCKYSKELYFSLNMALESGCIDKQKIFTLYKKINIYCNENNQWLFNGLGFEYNQVIKSLSFDIDLQNMCSSLIHGQIEEIKTFIQGVSIPGIGSFFEINLSNISINKDLILWMDSLTLALQNNPLLELNALKTNLNKPDDSFILFDQLALNNIINNIQDNQNLLNLNAPENIKYLVINMVKKNLQTYIPNQLTNILKFTKDIDIIAIKNFDNSISKLQNISIFCTVSLNTYVPIDELIKQNFMLLKNKILDILKNSIYVRYESLNAWNGKNIWNFLFNCEKNEAKILFAGNNDILQILQSITSILDIYDDPLIHYLNNQLFQYFNNQPANHISMYHDFLLNQMDTLENSNFFLSSNKDQFFLFHLQNFKNTLIKKQKQLKLEDTTTRQEKAYKKFNKIIDYFPFDFKSVHIIPVYKMKKLLTHISGLNWDHIWLEKIFEIKTINNKEEIGLRLRVVVDTEPKHILKNISWQFGDKKTFDSKMFNEFLFYGDPFSLTINLKNHVFKSNHKDFITIVFTPDYSFVKFMVKYFYGIDRNECIARLKFNVINKYKKRETLYVFVYVENFPSLLNIIRSRNS